MKWKLCRSCILTAAALVLPGCLAINAVLGVMGYLATGPAQLAGTIYSVTEYTYEYAVHDKTPDEVIEDKFSWLLLPEEDPEISGYAKAFKKSVLSPPMADVDPEVQLADSTLGASPSITLIPGKSQVSSSVMQASLKLTPKTKTAAAKPQRIQRQRRTVKESSPVTSAIVTSTPTFAPQHEYVERETDPLLVKLDRLEQTFRQAESIVSNEPSQGLLLSVQPNDAEQSEQGISGSWSIRHGLMQHTPIVSPDSIT